MLVGRSVRSNLEIVAPVLQPGCRLVAFPSDFETQLLQLSFSVLWHWSHAGLRGLHLY